jgi:hypothetical protein
MSDKYRFEELDRETRDYLLYARDQEGKGAPGLYVGQTNGLPVIGIVVGFTLIIATVLITFPPTDPPVKEAMLQTAGFLLGGWMVVAAMRVWSGSKAGRYAGHFVYADPENLYVASGSTVDVTNLADLREAKAVQNFNQGKYQNTSITLKLGADRKTIQVGNEERGRRLNVFLNAVAYMRDGGEDGKDDGLRKLSPEAMGAAAKVVARTGEFPADPSRAEEGDAIRIPQVRREGRPSTGLFGIVAVILIGTALFLGFLAINYPFRDEAVFDRIKELPSKDQPPALRLYLAHDKFTAHRDEAQHLLDSLYTTGVAINIQGFDADMKRGLSEVVLALKDRPQGVLSLRATEEGPPKGQESGSAARQKVVSDKLADKWGSTIGDGLVVFATLEDAELPANIDVRWKFGDGGEIDYTVTFRKSPDEVPVLVKTGTVRADGDANHEANHDANHMADLLADQILKQSVGMTKIRPGPEAEDF